jgi:hypothetical protein
MTAKKSKRARRKAPSDDSAGTTMADVISIRRLIGRGRLFEPDATDGTYRFLMRVCGGVRKAKYLDGERGTGVSLHGDIVARLAEGAMIRAPKAFLPPEPSARALEILKAYKAANTRDRPLVLLDYDLWAICDSLAPGGQRIMAQGKAALATPVDDAIAAALDRPYAVSPGESLS